MAITRAWPGGSTNVTPTSYSIPQAGEVNWPNLTNFLVALAEGAQGTTFQKFAVRTATTTPVTVSTNDCAVAIDLASPGAVAVTLPAGANKQVFYIADAKGDAGSNNVTITPNVGETINGGATFVMDVDSQSVGMVFDSATLNWIVFLNTLPGATNNPMTTTGDMIYAATSGTPAPASRLAIGSNAQVLIVSTNVPSWSFIADANIDASAAIAVSKLAAITASRAVVSDGSGFISASVTTSTEISYVSGVTSSIQTQLDAKTANPMTTTGDIIYASNTATPATAARLGIGSASTVLIVSGGLPTWGQIVNASVSASAAIDGTKISPNFGSQNITTSGGISTTGSGALTIAGTTTLSALGTGVVHANASGVLSSSLIVNADVNAAAAIAGTKISPDFGSQNITTSGNISTTGSGTLTVAGSVTFSTLSTGVLHSNGSGAITSSLIVNADVSSTAAIAGTKLDFGYGTTAPYAAVYGMGSSSNNAILELQYAAGAVTQGPNLRFIKSRGANVTTRGTVVANDTLGELLYSGFDSTGTPVLRNGASILGRVMSTISSTSFPTQLEFYTTPDSSVTPQINQTIAKTGQNTIGPTPAVQASFSGNFVRGVTDATAATTGYVGEYIESTVTVNTNVGTTNQYFDATSLSVSAGDWDLHCSVYLTRNSATYTDTAGFVGISTTSGNSSAGLVDGLNVDGGNLSLSTTFGSRYFQVNAYRQNISATTTYYLKFFPGQYSAGNPQYKCTLSARRMR